ncbi:MAG: DUF3301 domain-containing protein [Pseudomonadota bacterium]
MDHGLILGALAIGLVVAFWMAALRTREQALRLARMACRRAEVQFLDQTVALERLRPYWGESGLVLRRTYRFEFSSADGGRRDGYLTLLGRRPEQVWLDLPDGGLWERDDAAGPMN